MRYITRPGIVSLRICDTDLLVSSRASWEEVPRVRAVERHIAAIITLMEKGESFEEALSLFFRFINKPEHVIRERFEKSIGSLLKDGFLICVEETEQ